MDSDMFQIDTKGKCLLCLSTCNNNGLAPPKVNASPTAFKMLLRYMKIDIMKRDNLSSTFSPPPVCTSDSNISVELCERCHSLTSQFHKFFQAYERIRMELDKCAGQLHDAIEEGVKDVERVREYRKLIKPPEKGFIRPMDTINANIAENLRREMMEKCSKRISLSTPRIFAIPSKRHKYSNQSSCSSSAIKVQKRAEGPAGPAIRNCLNITATSIPKDDIYDVGAGPSLSIDDISLLERDPLEASDSDTFEIQSSTEENEDANIDHDEALQDMDERKLDLTKSHSHSSVQCPHCHQMLSNNSKLRVHLTLIHTFLYFSPRLPPGTTEEQLNSAIKIAVGKRIVIKNRNGQMFCGSLVCRKPFGDTNLLKMHMLTMHFDEIVSNYFGKIEQQRNIVDVDVENTSIISNSVKRETMEVSSTLVDSEGYVGSPWLPVSDIFEVALVKQPNLPEEIERKVKKTDDELGLNVFEDGTTDSECAKDPMEVDSDQQRLQLEKSMVPGNNSSTIHKGNPGTGTSSSISVGAETTFQDKRKCRSTKATVKWECRHCGKILANQNRLQIHTKKLHPAAGDRTLYRCVHCSKEFKHEATLIAHGTEHTFTIFNNRFPPGTTEDEFKEVVNKLMSQQLRKTYMEIGGVLYKKFGCPYCPKNFMSTRTSKDKYQRRVHILQFHLDQIVSSIEQDKLKEGGEEK